MLKNESFTAKNESCREEKKIEIDLHAKNC